MARRDIKGAVDFAYLERYAGGDVTVVEEVLVIFREQAGMWMRLLEHPDGRRDAAHTLKGAARGIGAISLGHACEAAEAGGPVEPVLDALDLVLADIAAYLHEEALRSLKTPR